MQKRNGKPDMIDKAEVIRLVGMKVRSLRIENKKSIESLALDAGMDYTQVSRIELGKINTSLFQIYKISKSLNVSVVEIMHVLP